MDELERTLRDVLTDDRLDVPMPAGAVSAVHRGVRRRRQRRAVLASASAVAVVALGAGGFVAFSGVGDQQLVVPPGGTHATPADSGSPTPSPKPTQETTPVVDRVDWQPLPYDATHPVTIPGTVPDPTVPWCTAAQLSAGTDYFQGAAGGLMGDVTVRNTGAACGVQGVPDVVGYDAQGHRIALSPPNDAFLAHPWLALRHDERVTMSVQLSALTARCVGAVTRLTVAMHDGSTVNVAAAQAGRSGTVGVTPPCDQGDDTTYRVNGSAWQLPGHNPTLPWQGIEARVDSSPPTVMQGDILDYRVELQPDPGVSLPSTCLPFRESLLDPNGTSTPIATETYLLPCKDMTAGSAFWNLEMQLRIPPSTPAGQLTVSWETPIADLQTGTTVTVVAAPPPCRQDQLAISGRPRGEAAGSYYQAVVFTNTSGSACSLRGYPGVEFVDGSGRPVRSTRAIRNSGQPIQTVPLGPNGGTASFLVNGGDFGPNGGASPCASTSGIRVIAPNLTTQVFVPAVGMNCDGGLIHVWPVVAGNHPKP